MTACRGLRPLDRRKIGRVSLNAHVVRAVVELARTQEGRLPLREDARVHDVLREERSVRADRGRLRNVDDVREPARRKRPRDLRVPFTLPVEVMTTPADGRAPAVMTAIRPTATISPIVLSTNRRIATPP